MQALIQFLPLVIVFILFYFMLLLPEKKRKKKYNEMISELKVNDDITTIGGIVGRIVSINDEYVVIESGPDRSKKKFVKNAIQGKVVKEENKSEVNSK